jgi:hypothetical protein
MPSLHAEIYDPASTFRDYETFKLYSCEDCMRTPNFQNSANKGLVQAEKCKI